MYELNNEVLLLFMEEVYKQIFFPSSVQISQAQQVMVTQRSWM